MRVFNLAEELEKERKKNKELEKQLNCKKEYTKYLPKDTELIILTKPDYDRQQEELLDKVFELQEVINKINRTLESSLSNMQKLVAISILLKKEKILEDSDNNE